jgi:hypothetical protein
MPRVSITKAIVTSACKKRRRKKTLSGKNKAASEKEIP